MALTEEQKRKLREKAAAEIALRQQQEEEEYYAMVLEEERRRQEQVPAVVRPVAIQSAHKPSLNMQHTVQHTVTFNVATIMKVFCIVFAVIVGISVFFPYITMPVMGSTLNRSLSSTYDWVLLISVVIFGIFFAYQERYVETMIVGLYSLGIFFLELWSLSSIIDKNIDSSVSYARYLLNNGAGYYMLLIGSIGLIGAAIFAIVDQRRNARRLTYVRPLWRVLQWLLFFVPIIGYFVYYAGWMVIGGLVNSGSQNLQKFANGY